MKLEGNGRTILIVEDDRTLARMLTDAIGAHGFDCAVAPDWQTAAAMLVDRSPVLTLLDVRLPDRDSLDAIEDVVEQCPVIVLTAYGTINQAVSAMRRGAFEYLTKPLDLRELELAISRALEVVSLRRSYDFVRTQLHPASGGLMIGRSRAFRETLHLVESVAQTDCTVLIQGESGVGKELVAQSIHQLSNRSAGNFVPVDCSTLQENLFESEVFGHERGAFTGADRRKEGLIEVAENGTAFFDEIGELTPGLQAKMLRLLETGRFRRLGGTADHSSSARFVAATNRDLAIAAQGGKYRSDLYYRLAAFVIEVPPLRARRDDIPLLATHFLKRRNFLRNVDKQLSPEAIDRLVDYDWPGNIRELRNIVERAILISGNAPEIRSRHIALDSHAPPPDGHEIPWATEPTLEQLKQSYVGYLMKKYEGKRAQVSRALGISERNTYRLIKRYGLS